MFETLFASLNTYIHAIPDSQRRAVQRVAGLLFLNVPKSADAGRAPNNVNQSCLKYLGQKFEVVETLIGTLSLRHIGVVGEEFAVSTDGMGIFGVLDVETTFDGCRFSIGVRNSNDKSMRLALTVGYRVLVCDNMAFHGDFAPVLAKHTKHLRLADILSVGVDRMQSNFEPMRKQVEAWKVTGLPDGTAKLVIYRVFVEGELGIPKHLARVVQNYYFGPLHKEFATHCSRDCH